MYLGSERAQFNKMIRDAEKGKIDLVITKSVSRFCRNTLDGLEYIRRLKKCGVGGYFESYSRPPSGRGRSGPRSGPSGTGRRCAAPWGPLGGLLVCGECGSPYRRVTYMPRGNKRYVWRCINRLEHGKKVCKGRHGGGHLRDPVIVLGVLRPST